MVTLAIRRTDSNGPERVVNLAGTPVLIGRAATCTIALADQTVSRLHAEITRQDDGTWNIARAKTAQKVWVNGVSIDASPLHGGETIRIGPYTIRFWLDEADGHTPAATYPEQLPGPTPHAPENPLHRMFAAWQQWPAAWQVGTAATLACAIVAMATIPTVISRASKQLAAAKPRLVAKKTGAATPSGDAGERQSASPAAVTRDADVATATSDTARESPATGDDVSSPPPKAPQPASDDAPEGDSTAAGDTSAPPPRTSLKELLDQAEETVHPEDSPDATTSAPQPPPAVSLSVAIGSQTDGPATRLPVPPKEEVAAALAKVDAVYAEEFADPGQSAALLPKLLDAANKSVKPANKFALLLAAEREALKSVSCRAAVNALLARAAAFEIDSLQARLDLLVDASKSSGEVAEDVLALTIDVTNEALADQRFDIATKASTLAGTVATDLEQSAKARAASGGPARPAPPSEAATVAAENPIEIARGLRTLVVETKKLHQKYEAALAALQETPDDAKSLEVVGKYRCFVKGEWPQGLPALAACGDKPLCDLAARELDLGVKTADTAAVFTLADDWWSFADTVKRSPSLPAEAEGIAKRHAADLYEGIVADLADPLEAELARKRIAAAADETKRRRPKGR